MEPVVVCAAFSQADFDAWKQNVYQEERGNSQVIDTTVHVNNSPHSNYTPHTDAAAYHSNSNGAHSNVSPHTDAAAWHSNYNGTHSNIFPHSDAASSHNDTPGTHTDTMGTHTDTISHTDTPGTHTDNNSGSHTDTVSGHTDTPFSHSNAGYPHTDITGMHTNMSFFGMHTNIPGVPHSDSPAFHSDQIISHCNIGGSHSDTTAHTDSVGSHNNVPYHLNTPAPHTDGISPHTNTTQPHTDSTSHSNITPHTDNAYPHTDNTSHTNVTPHTDSAYPHTDTILPHTNISPHTDTGFDHVNAIPSTPQFYNLVNAQIVSGELTIGITSYDKNDDAWGSQFLYSTQVLYKIEYRPSGGSWMTLQDYAVNDHVSLDTTKIPEGLYDVRVSVKNPAHTENGLAKTYDGPTSIVTVNVKHNLDPGLMVTNTASFLNFTYDSAGVLTPSHLFKPYTELYAGNYPAPAAGESNGLFITVNMKDPDSAATTRQQWQKASVQLKTSDNLISSANYPVTWTNGTTVASSENTIVSGHAFIPVDDLIAFGYHANVTITVTVNDYLDSACTIPAGAGKTQNFVSSLTPSDPTPLVINILKVLGAYNLNIDSVSAPGWEDDGPFPIDVKLKSDGTVDPTDPLGTPLVDDGEGNIIPLGYDVRTSFTVVGSGLYTAYANLTYYDEGNNEITSSVYNSSDTSVRKTLGEVGGRVNYEGSPGDTDITNFIGIDTTPRLLYDSSGARYRGKINIKYEYHYVKDGVDTKYATKMLYQVDASKSILDNLVVHVTK